MENVKIYIIVGDLLQDLPRSNITKFKERELLQIVKNKFQSITGIGCDPRKFRTFVKKYVEKIKKK